MFSKDGCRHFFGHWALLCPGERQIWHLWARFTRALHSLPGLGPAQVPTSFAHEKQISSPVLSPATCSCLCHQLHVLFLNLSCFSILSVHHDLLERVFSSLLSCVYLPVGVFHLCLHCPLRLLVPHKVQESVPVPSPLNSELAMGAPFDPEANHAVAGCLTCSFQ